MEPAREVAHLADGLEQLAGRGIDHLVRARRLAARLFEPHGQRDEPLLRAIMQVPLDAPPLGIASLHDPRPRGTDLLELRADLRGQPLVLERHPATEATALTRPGSSTSTAGIVDEGRQQLAVALEARDAPSLVEAGNLDRSPVRIHVATAGRRREGQREGRIAQGASQCVAQPAERDPTTELHRQIGDATPGEARREQSGEEAAGMAAWMKASGEVLSTTPTLSHVTWLMASTKLLAASPSSSGATTATGRRVRRKAGLAGANGARCRRSRRSPARCPANPGPGPRSERQLSRSTRTRRG